MEFVVEVVEGSNLDMTATVNDIENCIAEYLDGQPSGKYRINIGQDNAGKLFEVVGAEQILS